MNFRSVADLNSLIRRVQSKLKAENFELIVGVPRSGMLPASIISLNLNLPLMSIGEWLRNEAPHHGQTRSTRVSIDRGHDAKKVLIVDDSVATGGTLKATREMIPDHLLSKVKFFAVFGYSADDGVDFCCERVARPRFFEWNLMHSEIMKASCVDIDGVLCRDPSEDENDDGPLYLEFLKNADPYYLPTPKIHKLVTNRLEKYRAETELWLQENGVEYDELCMLKLDSKEDRKAQADYCLHKVHTYQNSGCDLFVESDYNQAVEIAKRTKKPVYCVATNELVNSQFSLRQAKKSALTRLKFEVQKHPALYQCLRKIFRLFKNH